MHTVRIAVVGSDRFLGYATIPLRGEPTETSPRRALRLFAKKIQNALRTSNATFIHLQVVPFIYTESFYEEDMEDEEGMWDMPGEPPLRDGCILPGIIHGFYVEPEDELEDEYDATEDFEVYEAHAEDLLDS